MNDDEIQPVHAGPVVILAGVLQILAGATCFTQGLQLGTLFVFWSWLWILPYVLMPLGLLQMALGATGSAGRDWAVIAGCGLTWVLAVMSVAFLIWSLMGGIIVLAFVWAGLACLAGAVAPFAIPGARAASSARRALYR